MLCAPTACTCSTSQLLKVPRSRQFWAFFTWKRALRRSSMYVFIFHLQTWLRTRRFSDPTFRLPEPQSRKNIVFCDFPTLPRTCIFFILSFSDLLFSCLLFSSLLSLSLLTFPWVTLSGLMAPLVFLVSGEFLDLFREDK